MTTWYTLLTEILEYNNESWEDIESSTLTDTELHISFDKGFGGIEGVPFTIWTKNFVYFPAVYDGAEWVSSVPRHPNGQPTNHIGG